MFCSRHSVLRVESSFPYKAALACARRAEICVDSSRLTGEPGCQPEAPAILGVRTPRAAAFSPRFCSVYHRRLFTKQDDWADTSRAATQMGECLVAVSRLEPGLNIMPIRGEVLVPIRGLRPGDLFTNGGSVGKTEYCGLGLLPCRVRTKDRGTGGGKKAGPA